MKSKTCGKRVSRKRPYSVKKMRRVILSTYKQLTNDFKNKHSRKSINRLRRQELCNILRRDPKDHRKVHVHHRHLSPKYRPKKSKKSKK